MASRSHGFRFRASEVALTTFKGFDRFDGVQCLARPHFYIAWSELFYKSVANNKVPTHKISPKLSARFSILVNCTNAQNYIIPVYERSESRRCGDSWHVALRACSSSYFDQKQ